MFLIALCESEIRRLRSKYLCFTNCSSRVIWAKLFSLSRWKQDMNIDENYKIRKSRCYSTSRKIYSNVYQGWVVFLKTVEAILRHSQNVGCKIPCETFVQLLLYGCKKTSRFLFEWRSLGCSKEFSACAQKLWDN